MTPVSLCLTVVTDRRISSAPTLSFNAGVVDEQGRQPEARKCRFGESLDLLCTRNVYAHGQGGRAHCLNFGLGSRQRFCLNVRKNN